MFDFTTFRQHLKDTALEEWADELLQRVKSQVEDNPHGKHEEWQRNFALLPELETSHIELNSDRIIASAANTLSTQQQAALKAQLLTFSPWRKGPYELFGVPIDTEWHSDWKWQRLAPHISSLQDRVVLDVGCGNGYHMWRMLGAGAQRVLGADPSHFFLMQFNIIKHYLGNQLPIHLMPLRSEDLPDFAGNGFDTVFSMGVLYHRKSPFNHLQELKNCLRPGGELVLETLVIEGDERTILFPQDRYAKMRNVWFIPSVAMLTLWLSRLGFCHIRAVDVNITSIEEQRRTEWMTFESLADFLDPADPSRTIEGYPAPMRACIVCHVR